MLHPWQGETMILIIVIAELIRWREHSDRRDLALPVLTLVLTGIPLVYYLALGHFDLSWHLAREASKHVFSFWSIALGIAPLAIVASLGYRGRPRDFLELMTRDLAAGGDPDLRPLGEHAERDAAARVQRDHDAALGAGRHGRPARGLGADPARAPGRGRRDRAGDDPGQRLRDCDLARRTRARWPATPTTSPTTSTTRSPYLANDPDPGGVLTRFYLGEIVPGATGRKTLVGDCLWSEPRCINRSLRADALFDGSLTRAQARRFVRRSGARFLLADCRRHVDVASACSGRWSSRCTSFGCASVVELVTPGGRQVRSRTPSRRARRAGGRGALKPRALWQN